MLEEIKKWTRLDWQLFDSLRSQAFQPTQEELEQINQQQKQNIVLVTQWYLSLYGIWFTGSESDFAQLYTLYIKWNWTENNGDIKEWVWGSDKLDSILEYNINSKNTLIDFCNFVISYEQ